MALRQLIIGKKLEALREKLAGVNRRGEEIAARREAMKKREEELAAAIDEVSEDVSDEDKAALEGELDKFEADATALDEEEKAAGSEREEIERQISELQSELDELNSRCDGAAKQERKDEKRMDNRSFFGMTMEARDAFFARQDVKEFCDRVRALRAEKRAVTGGELLIPTVVLDIVRERVEEASKLLKHVRLRSVPGKARQTVAGVIPEAVWTEQCAKLNELAIDFMGVEVDGYKVGGFVPVCNATLEDADNVALATEIITMLGYAIGMAVDKAIMYGTGKKKPHGIIPRLVETVEPDDYQTTAREWVDLFQSTRPLRGETANNHENCLQKIFVLHSPLSHKSAKRRLRKKNGLCQQENRHTFGANLPGIWCVLPVRITGSAVHPSKGRVIHHSAPLCCDSDCPAHRSERCRALHSFRSGSGA